MAKVIKTTDGREIRRVSRWIKIRTKYGVAKWNSLYDYATDENGWRTCENNFNANSPIFLDYFVYKSKTYATNQFYRMGGPWVGIPPIMYEDEEGKINIIGAIYMDGNIFDPPLYAEFDEYGEYVRLYKEVLK